MLGFDSARFVLLGFLRVLRVGAVGGEPPRSLGTNHPWSSEVRWGGFVGDSDGLPKTTIITGAQPKAKTSRTRLTRTIALRTRFTFLFVRSLWNAIHPSNGSLSLTRLARVRSSFSTSAPDAQEFDSGFFCCTSINDHGSSRMLIENVRGFKSRGSEFKSQIQHWSHSEKEV